MVNFSLYFFTLCEDKNQIGELGNLEEVAREA